MSGYIAVKRESYFHCYKFREKQACSPARTSTLVRIVHMGIGLCTGRKCSYKSHRTQDIRHFLISSKTNPYSRADYPPASPSATYFKREHLPISLLCSSLIAPGFSNLRHNLTTLSYERLHSSEKRIQCSYMGTWASQATVPFI